jgi:hypothetical protein
MAPCEPPWIRMVSKRKNMHLDIRRQDVHGTTSPVRLFQEAEVSTRGDGPGSWCLKRRAVRRSKKDG